MNTPTDLDEIQVAASKAAKTALEETAGYIENKNFVAAGASSKIAASEIAALQWLHATRRGLPRELLTLDIGYYRAWLMALTGYTEISKKNGVGGIGRYLLKRARLQTIELIHQHPDTPKVSELATLIEGWIATPEPTQEPS
jgi:hypothetical protein